MRLDSLMELSWGVTREYSLNPENKGMCQAISMQSGVARVKPGNRGARDLLV